jgi:hypothetical protein
VGNYCCVTRIESKKRVLFEDKKDLHEKIKGKEIPLQA